MNFNLFHKEKSSLKEKHDKYVAGASTFSKSIYRFPETYPQFIKKAHGCTVEDINGIKYTDFVSALGAISLGYTNSLVDNAVISQMNKGNIFSLCSDIEAECGEVLTKVTGTDKCLFLKTGTDAVNASLRLAKSYTNRPNIIYCSHGYHGWGSEWGISQPINKGIPSCLSESIKPFEYDNLESLENTIDKNTAAIIMEQITFSLPKNKNFVNDVINIAQDNGSLVILDNIVLFPRFNKINYNAQKTDVDMILLSKGIANGYSISAVVGKEDILSQRQNEEVFISGTFFGEALPMASTMKTLELCKKYSLSSYISNTGYDLQDGFNKLCSEKSLHIKMEGLPFRQRINYNNDISVKTLFLQETARQGIVFGNVIFPTLAHNNSIIEETLDKCDTALDVIASAVEQNIVEESIIGRKCQELQLRK